MKRLLTPLLVVYATWSIVTAALASTDERTIRHVSTAAARPCSTVHTGSLRVRTELTKALSESNVLFVSGPPNFWSGLFWSGRYENVPELKSTPPFVPISRVYSSLNLLGATQL